MTISGNYITMQREIADEFGDNQALLSPLADSALTTSPIQNAIQAAIVLWEPETFYFNDFRLEPTPLSPFKTVVLQEFYGATDYPLLATLACIKSVRVLISSNRHPLKERDANYMNDVSVNPDNTGQPTDYSFDNNQMRMYPIPSQIWPMGLTGTQRLPALVNPTDANAWTIDAYMLIKSTAKLIIARDVIQDDAMQAAMEKAIYGDPNFPEMRGYLSQLKTETRRRHGARTRIRPQKF